MKDGNILIYLLALTGLGIAGLVVWYLASGAQGPQTNTQLGHSG